MAIAPEKFSTATTDEDTALLDKRAAEIGYGVQLLATVLGTYRSALMMRGFDEMEALQLVRDFQIERMRGGRWTDAPVLPE